MKTNYLNKKLISVIVLLCFSHYAIATNTAGMNDNDIASNIASIDGFDAPSNEYIYTDNRSDVNCNQLLTPYCNKLLTP